MIDLLRRTSSKGELVEFAYVNIGEDISTFSLVMPTRRKQSENVNVLYYKYRVIIRTPREKLYAQIIYLRS